MTEFEQYEQSLRDDLQMHEYAAKAAGYWDKEFDCYSGSVNWKPRHDDGDAFRLAARLKLQVSFGTFEENECVCYRFGKPATFVTGTNIAAAAREAIFLTAVEIGKEMEGEK